MKRRWKMRIVVLVVASIIVLSLLLIAMPNDPPSIRQSGFHNTRITQSGVTTTNITGFTLPVNTSIDQTGDNVTVSVAFGFFENSSYGFRNISWSNNIEVHGFARNYSLDFWRFWVYRLGEDRIPYGYHTLAEEPEHFYSLLSVNATLNSTRPLPFAVILRWTLKLRTLGTELTDFNVTINSTLNVIHFNRSWLDPWKSEIYAVGLLGITGMVATLILLETRLHEETQSK